MNPIADPWCRRVANLTGAGNKNVCVDKCECCTTVLLLINSIIFKGVRDSVGLFVELHFFVNAVKERIQMGR